MSGITVNKFWHLGNYTFRNYRFQLENSCRRYFEKPGLIMLDAGCGSRISSLSYVPDNLFCIGIDVSFKNIAESNRKGKSRKYRNFSFIVASVTDLPFPTECFDLILCADVLEHIKSKRKAVHEISRVCRPQGKFLGSTTNLFNPLMLLDSLLPKKITDILTRKFAVEAYERHLRFTVGGLLQTLNEAGFESCGVELLGYPPFKPWLYKSYSRRLPWFATLWIAFDSLTNRKQLRLFKDTIVFLTSKNQISMFDNRRDTRCQDLK